MCKKHNETKKKKEKEKKITEDNHRIFLTAWVI